jgi:uncharacterized repeat protein (TIGR01451 family)
VDGEWLDDAAGSGAAIGLNGFVVDSLSYGDTQAGYTEGLFAPIDSASEAFTAIGRYPDALDDDNNTADFSLHCITPGGSNAIADAQGCFQLSITTSAEVNEGNTGTAPLDFVVSLSHPATYAITVDYQTSDITATAAYDYVASSGTLTFAAGNNSDQTIRVLASGDTTYEPDESFLVTLSNPGINSVLASNEGQGTILNDDDPCSAGSPQDVDLAISITGNPDPVVTGERVSYSVEITNSGSQCAQDVVVSSSIPEGTVLLDTQGCTEDAKGVPLCSLGHIRANANATYQVRFDVDATFSGSSISHDVSVSTTSNDTNPSNNSASGSVAVELRDSDGDGIPDIEDSVDNTGNTDLDGDGLPDWWEEQYNAYDPSADLDGDGLSNLDEYLNGSDPHDIDSDLDGLFDGWDDTPGVADKNACTGTDAELSGIDVLNGEQLSCRAENSILAFDDSVESGGKMALMAPRIVITPGFHAHQGSMLHLDSRVPTRKPTRVTRNSASVDDDQRTWQVGELPHGIRSQFEEEQIETDVIYSDSAMVRFAFATPTALLPSDWNEHADIYVYDAQTAEFHLASSTRDGGSGNDASRNPIIDEYGSHVVFFSDATDLLPENTTGLYRFWIDSNHLENLK